MKLMKYYVKIEKDAYVDIICVDATDENNAKARAILEAGIEATQFNITVHKEYPCFQEAYEGIENIEDFFISLGEELEKISNDIKKEEI